MSGFVYVVTEGVHDVAFLGKLLRVCYSAERVRSRSALDEPRRAWLDMFRWPVGDDIERLAVPAPVFYRTTAGAYVALRNAQGIGKISATIEADLERFSRREASRPETIGVVLDADDEDAGRRFARLADVLSALDLTPPATYGDFSTANPRVGVFALPEPGANGTLEDLLLVLGDASYPELTAAARAYVEAWLAKELTGRDWREIKKPAGRKKATIAAMTALLKPGKSTQTSLDDNRWVCEETKALPRLEPCIAFLRGLLNAPAAAS